MMKMYKKTTLLTLLLVCIGLSGCSVRMADLTVGSSKNFDLNSGNLKKGKRVIGEDLYPVILLPFGIPNIKTAMDNAIQKEPCAVGLSNVVINNIQHHFLVGQHGYSVEGDLIIDASQTECKNKVIK